MFVPVWSKSGQLVKKIEGRQGFFIELYDPGDF